MRDRANTFLIQARAIGKEITGWRRDIHRRPELGFQEVRTAQYIVDRLAEMGISARTGVGKTGVVAIIGTPGGNGIGLRADMDALPIQEENDVPYASQHPGVMHACGHDTHVAMLLGAARLLAERRDELAG
ncbi:MAG: M20/M25/M40 family metallo-hydrolase, partial [Anaerolineales bacterium]|nr:M20/M25/M40 family metallo-hydrolase [Anaerolineales bacterium]